MRVEEQAEIAASPARVWELVCDPAAFGTLEPGFLIENDDGAPARPGVRARYRAMMRIGPVPVGGNVEIVEFEPGRELAWTSFTGIDQRFRLRVRPSGDAGARLTVRFGYSSPGALGFVADIAAYAQVRGLMRRLVAAVKLEAERPVPRKRGAVTSVR